ncbi:O-acyltransferase like protein-like [Aricia agestis]|uniref:O-acyltransferase like protein-like n=1 Tax=Aricia agestis TaxID=91739 RepID=UPI001C2041F6|nr:O-acyltransferase like protein-like [Aricia agestis]
MPAIYHLDNYDRELQDIGHTYCMVDFDLAYFDQTSDLFKTVMEYSEHYVSHFNHTQLRYGIDVLKTCNKTNSKATVSKRTLEGCLNETFKREYKLSVHSYYDPLQYFLFNGTLAIQTYFVLTGLLMSYKMLLYLETVEPNWRVILKGIFLRWLRLTPSYAVVLAVMATFVRFIRHGPQWELAAGQDVVDCRARWWLNLLYINNYMYNAQCMPHSWYIAADFQLCCIGMAAMILIQRIGFRNIILSLLFMVGIIVPAIQTYLYDLDGLLITSPGATRTFFAMDPTFNETYKTGHSNLSSFVIGMALGYAIYYLRERGFDIGSFKKYRYVYWLVAPLTFIYILSGYVFYRDAPRADLSVRVVTAALAKPLFGVMIAIIIAGLAFRIENFYRSILEWKIWIVPGRLSYCIYILHLPFIRIFAGTKTSLIEATKYNFFALMFSVLAISFAMAIPLWLFIESPFYELIKRNPKKSSNVNDFRTHL